MKQDLDTYITKGDYDRTRPQEKGSKSNSDHDSVFGDNFTSGSTRNISACFISATYIEPRKNRPSDYVPPAGAGQSVVRPPSTSEMTQSKK